jgi:hypothetical protein
MAQMEEKQQECDDEHRKPDRAQVHEPEQPEILDVSEGSG